MVQDPPAGLPHGIRRLEAFTSHGSKASDAQEQKRRKLISDALAMNELRLVILPRITAAIF